MKKNASGKFLYFVVTCVGLIVLLYFVQKWMRPSSFVYRFAETPASSPAVPGDISLTEVILSKPPRFGRSVTFKQLLSEPKGLLVNFWATWCPPCIEELPSLEMYHRQSKASGAAVPKLVLISVDDGLQPIQQLFGSLDFKASFEVYLDRSGAFAQKMGSSKYPETYYISPAGDVLYKWIGPQDWLSQEVLEKLKVGTASQPKAQNKIE